MDTNTLTLLQKKYRTYRSLVVLILALLIAALIFVFINRNITLVLIAAALVFHFLFLRRKQKEYAQEITKANLEATLCKQLGAAVPSEQDAGPVTTTMVRSAELLPFKEEKGSPLYCWGMQGTKSGYSVSLCDATFAEDFKLAKKGKKRVHFNSGAWIHLELPADTGMDLRILDETSVPTPIRMDYFAARKNMENLPMKNPALSQRYVMYRSKEQNALPSDAFDLQLKRLMEYTPGYAALSIRGNQFDLFLRGRFLARPVSMTKAPTRELLEFNPLPELDYVIKLAKTL